MHTRIPRLHFARSTAVLALIAGTITAAAAASFPPPVEDGTSNTIGVEETPEPGGRPGTGGVGSIADGTSNTINFGETGNPGSGGTGVITDGTSNTINVGDSTPPQSVPDGGATAMLLAGGLAAVGLLRRRISAGAG